MKIIKKIAESQTVMVNILEDSVKKITESVSEMKDHSLAVCCKKDEVRSVKEKTRSSYADLLKKQVEIAPVIVKLKESHHTDSDKTKAEIKKYSSGIFGPEGSLRDS